MAVANKQRPGPLSVGFGPVSTELLRRHADLTASSVSWSLRTMVRWGRAIIEAGGELPPARIVDQPESFAASGPPRRFPNQLNIVLREDDEVWLRKWCEQEDFQSVAMAVRRIIGAYFEANNIGEPIVSPVPERREARSSEVGWEVGTTDTGSFFFPVLTNKH